jgi:diguanylate cyclase (GGDEF)-like protein/PAS domain S-box-containing protein
MAAGGNPEQVPAATYRWLFEHGVDAVLLLTLHGQILAANAAASQLFGYTPEELRDISWACLADPAASPPLTTLIERTRDGWFYRTMALHRCDGERFPAEVLDQAFVDSSGHSWISVIVREARGHRQPGVVVSDIEESVRNAFEASHVGMALVACDGRFLRVNQALCDLVDFGADELLALTFRDITHPEDLAVDLDRAAMLWSGALRSYTLEKRLIRRDGEVVWGLLTASAVDNEDGFICYGIAQVQDITARKGLELQLRTLATRDPLTGLTNRTEFLSRLDSALAGDHSLPVAVLFVDLDAFKPVNDAHGHAVGDQLLVEVGRRLEAAVRDPDVVARLGGDEFGIVLTDGASVPAAIAVAKRIIASVGRPTTIDGRGIRVTASVGVAVTSPGSNRVEGLLQRADTALYRAKADGGGRLSVFGSS